MTTELGQEMETFRRELPGLLADSHKVGKYVLIRGKKVAGIYDTQNEAIDAGYLTFGIVPFLAKHIVEKEELPYFPRMIHAIDNGYDHAGRGGR